MLMPITLTHFRTAFLSRFFARNSHTPQIEIKLFRVSFKSFLATRLVTQLSANWTIAENTLARNDESYFSVWIYHTISMCCYQPTSWRHPDDYSIFPSHTKWNASGSFSYFSLRLSCRRILHNSTSFRCFLFVASHHELVSVFVGPCDS